MGIIRNETGKVRKHALMRQYCERLLAVNELCQLAVLQRILDNVLFAHTGANSFQRVFEENSQDKSGKSSIDTMRRNPRKRILLSHRNKERFQKPQNASLPFDVRSVSSVINFRLESSSSAIMTSFAEAEAIARDANAVRSVSSRVK